MKAVFVELPAFERYRTDYLDDADFRGLRKLRYGDPRRGKGKRGGLRVIYYWWNGGSQFWLFTLYDKDEMADLGTEEKKALKSMLKAELEARR